ncbi:hypothetical protein EMCRGX_G021425 [Ephydatia muelleri]
MADFSENPFASPQATPVKEPPHQSPGSFIPLAAKSKPKTPTAPTTTIEIAEPTVHSSDQKKLQELQLKEEALAKREAELKAKEVQLPIVRPNNFPPLPPCCPIQPCCYVNLTEQIPPAELWKMRVLTILLIYYWGLLIFNFICAIAGVIGHSSSSYDYGTTLGISIAYVILCAPAALFCWWYPVYRGYKSNSSLSFLWFFFVMGFQILGFVLNFLGIPTLGAAGLINGIPFFSGGSPGVGAMFMICCVLWLLTIPVSAVLLFLVHSYYRSSGRSINEATREAMTGAASNKSPPYLTTFCLNESYHI